VRNVRLWLFRSPFRKSLRPEKSEGIDASKPKAAARPSGRGATRRRLTGKRRASPQPLRRNVATDACSLLTQKRPPKDGRFFLSQGNLPFFTALRSATKPLCRHVLHLGADRFSRRVVNPLAHRHRGSPLRVLVMGIASRRQLRLRNRCPSVKLVFDCRSRLACRCRISSFTCTGRAAILGSWPHPIREIDWRERQSRRHHQGWQRPCTTAAHRGRVELPIPATRQQGHADQDRGRATGSPRDCLEGQRATGDRL
jgi:hypothetical protein